MVDTNSHHTRASMIRMRLLVGALARLTMALLAIGAIPGANATCTFYSGYSLQTFNLTISTISVPRNAAVGTILATTQQVAVTGTFASCKAPGNVYYYYNGGTMAPSPSNTVNTNIPGIGLRFFFNNNGGPSFRFTQAGSASSSSYPGDWGWHNNGAGYFGVQIVVTGPVGSGQFDGTANASVTLDSLLVDMINVAPFNVTARTCVTPSVSVPLGKHRSAEFTGVGSTTSATSFSLSLSACPAGLKSVQYEIDPSTTIVTGTGNSVVTLDSGSSATGIGIQLLDGNSKPFALGAPVTFSSYNGATGGSYQIPLNARYYQTNTKIGAGAANTEMTFTITYQ